MLIKHMERQAAHPVEVEGPGTAICLEHQHQTATFRVVAILTTVWPIYSLHIASLTTDISAWEAFC